MEERDAPQRTRPRPFLDPSAFRVGEVLSASFRIWGRGLGTLLVLIALAHSPLLLYTLYRVAAGDVPPSWTGPPAGEPAEDGEIDVDLTQGLVRSGLELLAEMLLGYVATAVVVFAVFRALRGERAQVSECLREGLRRLPVVLGAGVLAMLLYLLPLAAAGAAVAGVALAIGGGAVTTVVLGALALLIALVPMVWLVLSLWVVAPVAVVERTGPVGALRRSFALVRGRRWQLLLLVLVLTGIGMGVGMVTAPVAIASMSAGLLLQRVATLFAGALSATVVTVAYHDLRREKEGLGGEEIAAIFA